jgi:signal transduction histidine kinase
MALRVGTAIELSRHRLLLDEKEKFYHVVDSMNNGLVVFDHNMNATFINNKARELLAINLREENTDIVGYICRRFNVIYDGDLARAMRSGPVVFDIERAETGDTRSLILEAYSHVVKSPVKGPGEILMILTDVTEERKEELSKWNFLGLISHKLRTPIAVAHGTVALLRDGMLGPVTEKQEGAYMRISESLHTLIGLVDKLLSFTTIESRTIPAGGELIKVKEYLGELTLPAAVSGSAKKTELMIDCADESVAVRMSRAHLDLIMKNLIENALKFNDKKIARVTVRAGKTAWGVEISVSDNGCGIPQEEKGKIFKKFYQIEKYFTGNVEGAGLGLSIVKRIAGVYGGQVELISEMGEGSTFIVKLPVKG